MPTLLIAALLRALDAFRVFDLPYLVTGGGPASSTETMSTYAYKTLFLGPSAGLRLDDGHRDVRHRSPHRRCIRAVHRAAHATGGLIMATIAQPRATGGPGQLARRGGFGFLVVAIVVWSLFPFVWEMITSFEPDKDLSRFAPQWLPIPGGTLQHYRNVFVAKTSLLTSSTA